MRQYTKEFSVLFEKYTQGTLSDKETIEFYDILSGMSDEEFEVLVTAELERSTAASTPSVTPEILQRVQELKPAIFKYVSHSRERKLFRLSTSQLTWTAAAVILIVGLISIIRFRDPRTADPMHSEIVEAQHILPGKNRGVVMANGRSLTLDEDEGELILTAHELKYKNGQVLTQVTEDLNVHIPKGGTYKIVLPDGSAVWLNSDTKLEIPEGFSSQNRTLYLDGEAYFDVKKGSSPFLVRSKTQTIEVLGTAFNVKTYSDESSAKTTLIHGSLRVKTQEGEQLIKPNEKCIVNTIDHSSVVQTVTDTSPSSSWKEGYFDFNSVDLTEALKMVGRWYDINIEGTDELPDIQLGGKMSKGVRLSVFLKFLETNYNIIGTMKPNKTLVVKESNH